MIIPFEFIRLNKQRKKKEIQEKKERNDTIFHMWIREMNQFFFLFTILFFHSVFLHPVFFFLSLSLSIVCIFVPHGCCMCLSSVNLFYCIISFCVSFSSKLWSPCNFLFHALPILIPQSVIYDYYYYYTTVHHDKATYILNS